MQTPAVGRNVNQMKHLLILSILSLIVIRLGLAYAQNEDASQILKTVLSKQEKINDYRVNIEIELDVEFINMPVKRAVMYYKHPRMIKFESDEFIMLPQKGLDFSLRKFLEQGFTSILTGYEPSGSIPNCWLSQKWKIIPARREATRSISPTPPIAMSCLR
jgi:hypothetical protein